MTDLEPEAVQRARRDANNEIAENARELDFSAPVPFVCECRDKACQGFARLQLDAYDVIATQPAWSILGEAHGFRVSVIENDTDRMVIEIAQKAA
jgi:hypothetical protein